MELEEVVVFFGHGVGRPLGEEGVYFGEEVFVFGLLVEEDEEVTLEFGVLDVGKDGVGTVDGFGEGSVVANADLEEDEEGEDYLGFLVGRGSVLLEEGVDMVFSVAPELGASLDAVVFDGVEEEGMAVGLETEGEKHGICKLKIER